MNRHIKGKDFTKVIIEAQRLTIVQFKTEWNGSCQIIATIYDELCKVYSAKAKFFNVDTQQEYLIAKEYGITEQPAILFFKAGKVVDHAIGLTPKNMLIAKIENAIAGIDNSI